MNGNDGSKPLDEDVISSLRDLGGDEFLAELAGLFLGDAPAHLTAIDAALAAGDGAKVAQSAHALKSSAANMGAVHLQAALGQLEQSGRSGDLAGASTVAATVREEYARAVTALETFRQPGA